MVLSDDKRFNVYVIELSYKILYNEKFKSKNPRMIASLECFYVGMTGRTPEERYEQHKKGYKSNRYAKKYGLRLRPDMYEKFNPMSYDEAVKMEKLLAERLREKGHGVWQN